MVDDHMQKHADHTGSFWALLMFDLWFKHCVAGRQSRD